MSCWDHFGFSLTTATMKTWLVLFCVVFLSFSQHLRCEDEDGDSIVIQKADSTDEDGEELPMEEGEDDLKQENDVYVMTENNFDLLIDQHEIILVEFYAPWCGHCKQLAPEYEKAAAVLKDSDPKVVLGKVDATEQKSLASRFGVSGYPTLKFFKSGQAFDYDGPRQADGIVSYMEERASPTWQPPPDAVITLTSENFREVVDNADLILVEFYAPWCGHCKKLAPEYEKAAQDLQRLPEPIPLAKVDATEEKDIASQYDVTGYPTLKVFRKGVEFEYNGGRDRRTIVEYMTSQQGPPSKLLSGLKEVRSSVKTDSVAVVAFFDGEDDSRLELFQKAVNDLREDYDLFHSFDVDSRVNYRANSGSVLIFHPEHLQSKHEPKWHVLQIKDETKSDDIKSFISDHSAPLVGHYSHTTKDKVYSSRRPLFLMFYTVDFSFDHRQATQLWRLKLADVAKDYHDITFAVADDDTFSDEMKAFGFEDSGEEISIGIISDANKKYAMESFDSFDSDDVRDFIERYKNGDLKPQVKSQPLPKKSKGPVKTLVGKNFEQIVFDKSKDVLVEFYAPWCGHCKKYEPEYKNLAKELKKEKNLVLAKIDATANDTPEGYKVEGFPTIYFAPAKGDKMKPVKYEGNRDKDDVLRFLKEHSTVSFKSAKEEL